MTGSNRIIVICLDGYEHMLGERLMNADRMPALKALVAAGTSMPLNHGDAKDTGLAWEHFATGLNPERSGRWGAVDFDPATYAISQPTTRMAPMLGHVPDGTIIVDAPYFDLARAPGTRGLVGWGAHDPGIAPLSVPSSLASEIADRFGPYPASEWIYGFTWPSARRTQVAAAALAQAVSLRAEVATWLLANRLPDWRLAIVSISEFHSAIEPFWHGVDTGHPLHAIDSAAASRDGLERVYEVADRMIGSLCAAFPEATVVAFSMHGMGPNAADVPAMALLPELLFRRQFGKPKLKPRALEKNAAGVPILADDQPWFEPSKQGLASPLSRLAMRMRRSLLPRPDGFELDWMPATLYHRYWRRMDAFAIPAYYDGRIRINLKGRESAGRVAPADYDKQRNELARLLEACRDPLTGAEAIESIEFCPPAESAAPSGADMRIKWRPRTLGLAHADLGVIGPLPYRRTGGHTGDSGFAVFAGPPIGRGILPTASSFDILPTILDLLGESSIAGFSGQSLGNSLFEGKVVPALRPPESSLSRMDLQ
jgi:predicted AlkP superfamily phosphohydrolase/phosphomutase